MSQVMEIRYIVDIDNHKQGSGMLKRLFAWLNSFQNTWSSRYSMPRPPKPPRGTDLLETKISELTSLIKEMAPQARVEITFERCEDEDAHIRVYPPPLIDPEEVAQIELKIGESCNQVLIETGLFIIGAVCD